MNIKFFYLITLILFFNSSFSMNTSDQVSERDANVEGVNKRRKLDSSDLLENGEDALKNSNVKNLSELALLKVINNLITPDLDRSNFSASLLKKIINNNDIFTEMIQSQLLEKIKPLFFKIFQPRIEKIYDSFSFYTDFSCDGKFYAYSARKDRKNIVLLLTVQDNTVIKQLELSDECTSMKFTLDSQSLLLSDEKKVYLWNFMENTCKTLYQVPKNSKIRALIQIENGKRLLLINFNSDDDDDGYTLELINLEDKSKRIICNWDVEDNHYFNSFLFDKASNVVLLNYEDGDLLKFDLTNFQESDISVSDLQEVEDSKVLMDLQEENIFSMKIIPNTKFALAMSAGGDFYLWNLTDRKFFLIKEFEIVFVERPGDFIAVTANGKYCLAAIDDKISIFDLTKCNANEITELFAFRNAYKETNYYNVSLGPDSLEHQKALIAGYDQVQLMEFEWPESLTIEQMVLILKLNEIKIQDNNVKPFDLLHNDYYKQIFKSFSKEKQECLSKYFEFPIWFDEFLLN